jgi:transcriptional regulator of met regulon
MIAATMLLSVWGCDKDQTAGLVKAQRIRGNVESARDLALTALKEKPERMGVWRELAMTNLDYVRIRSGRDVNAVALSLESALMCAAVTQVNDGKPVKEWEIVSKLAASELLGRASRVMRDLKVGERTEIHTNTDLPLEDLLKGESIYGYHETIQTKALVVEDELKETIRESSALIGLYKRLGRPDDEGQALVCEQVERQFTELAKRVDYPESYVAGYRAEGEEAVAQAVSRAAKDLQETGHFRTETIFDNKILE